MVYFEKKGKSKISLSTRFEMRLGLDASYLLKLRPCLMFGSEPGAQVEILSHVRSSKNETKTVLFANRPSSRPNNLNKSSKNINSQSRKSLVGGNKSIEK